MLAFNSKSPLENMSSESIYDIDRLHIVVHGVDETDGKDNWGWRKSCLDLFLATLLAYINHHLELGPL